MQLVTYLPVIAEPRAFIDFWAARYTDIDDDFYATNIGEELTEVRVLAWFEWKNGMPLSPRKRQSVLQNYVARLGDLDQISEDEAAADTLARFGGGIIWRIFWLHCWRPSRFPIYD